MSTQDNMDEVLNVDRSAISLSREVQDEKGQRFSVNQHQADLQQVDWADAPRMDLVVRTFALGLRIFWSVFFPTYLAWSSSRLVVVLDAESSEDHRVGTILSSLNLISRIQVKYEAMPPNGTTCSDWRSEGYARQQYSNFYADLYTDADFVAIADTDAIFTTAVVPSDLFEDGKPIVVGKYGPSGWWSNVTKRAIGGREDVARFMFPAGFPFIIKSDHLAEMRTDIASNLGVATFEQAFNTICSEGEGSYSQFNIIFNYLWHYKNSEYSWHLAGASPNNIKNNPVIRPMLHFGKSGDIIGPRLLYDALCAASKNLAGNCGARADAEAAKAGKSLCGLRQESCVEIATAKWETSNHSCEETYANHMNVVSAAGLAFTWKGEDPTDYIVTGNVQD